MQLGKKFNNFLKLVPKLPVLLQALLIPVLAILWVVTISPVVIVFFVLLCGKKYLKGFIEKFIEQKNQEINRVLNKVQVIDDVIKLQLELENTLLFDNLEASKEELEKAITTFQTSRRNLHQANAQLDEAIKDFFSDEEDSKLKPKLPVWRLVKKLPENWRRDLADRRREWIKAGYSESFIYFKTLEWILEMGWAALMIKWEDFYNAKAKKKGS